MECCVHSPCGRYIVRYKCDAESMCIDVVPKVSAFEPSPSIHYVALLRDSHVVEITTAAGVRKEFSGFADMTYNALIGRSPCVRFFIETCEEMRSRITAEVAQRGRGLSDSYNDDSETSQLSESSRTQRFFTLDYDVDFTRAVFPVPLVHMKAEGDTATTPLTAENGGNSRHTTGAHYHHHHRPSQDQPHLHAQKVMLVEGGTIKKEPGCDSGKDDENNSNNNCSSDDSKTVIARLQAENEKLKRENEALTRLSREKMLEMQRLCEDFQQRVEGARDAERLQKKLTALRVRLRQAEEERDEAHAAFARLKQRTLRSSPQCESSRRSVRTQRRSRFDTPSPSHHHRRQREREHEEPKQQRQQQPQPPQSNRRSVSRRLGDSPAPRGRTGGRPELRVTSRGRSASGSGIGGVAKKRLWADGNSSRCSSVAGSRCSSRNSCERLYRTPTVSSRQHERNTPLYVPRHAVFR
ncbi:uncharacterized protein TM35_000045400 [Trypanosoma theileri]|uniref:Uncharacterized protein n=1 Tax=Trypanosoma theileri TaxID=67003 RepID=A0A1X0P5W2_9TRYP|nr:uncharacterized protein TM35_000045400 [Trypanosoma theileri]ORC92326.1 hypothetical protein TM35_000045400 [Trypanosoma theileri]